MDGGELQRRLEYREKLAEECRKPDLWRENNIYSVLRRMEPWERILFAHVLIGLIEGRGRTCPSCGEKFLGVIEGYDDVCAYCYGIPASHPKEF